VIVDKLRNTSVNPKYVDLLLISTDSELLSVWAVHFPSLSGLCKDFLKENYITFLSNWTVYIFPIQNGFRRFPRPSARNICVHPWVNVITAGSYLIRPCIVCRNQNLCRRYGVAVIQFVSRKVFIERWVFHVSFVSFMSLERCWMESSYIILDY